MDNGGRKFPDPTRILAGSPVPLSDSTLYSSVILRNTSALKRGALWDEYDAGLVVSMSVQGYTVTSKIYKRTLNPAHIVHSLPQSRLLPLPIIHYHQPPTSPLRDQQTALEMHSPLLTSFTMLLAFSVGSFALPEPVVEARSIKLSSGDSVVDVLPSSGNVNALGIRDSVNCKGSAFCELLGSSCDDAYRQVKVNNIYTAGK